MSRGQTVLIVLQSISQKEKKFLKPTEETPKNQKKNSTQPNKKTNQTKPPHVRTTQFPMLAYHSVEKYQELLIGILKTY